MLLKIKITFFVIISIIGCSKSNVSTTFPDSMLGEWISDSDNELNIRIGLNSVTFNSTFFEIDSIYSISGGYEIKLLSDDNVYWRLSSDSKGISIRQKTGDNDVYHVLGHYSKEH